MAVRCSKCGRGYDVTLFQFGRTIQCDCGNTVSHSGVRQIKKDSTPPTRFILVRHGETDWNIEGRIQGQTSTGLNARGREQARQAALKVAAEHPQNLYSSDLARSMETADAIAKATGLEIIATPRLREADFGRWTGKTFDEVMDTAPGEFSNWVESDFHKAPQGGESAAELRERTIAILAEIAEKHPNETTVIVTHGGPCKYAIAHVLGISATGIYRYAIDNASVHIIEIGPYGWRLVTLNDTCHLAAETESEPAGDTTIA